MLTAALDGLIARAGIEGERLGEVAGGAVLKHSRDFNLTRESLLGTRISPETPGLRRRPGLRHRPRDGDPRRQQDRPRPGRLGDRLRRRHHLRRADRRSTTTSARSCSRPTAPARTSIAFAPCSRSGPGRSSPTSRATPSRAPASRWASTPRSWLATGESPEPRRTSSPRPPTRTSPPPTTSGFEDDLVTPVPRPRARPEPAPRLHRREARQAAARSSAARTAR